MAEEIDLEKCNLWNFRSSVTMTIRVCISSQDVPTDLIRSKSEKKLFVDGSTCGRIDTPEFIKSIGTSPGDDLEIEYSTQLLATGMYIFE